MKPLVAFLAATASATASLGAAAQERPQDRWNLADLYADTAAWNAQAATLEASLSAFAGCRGTLGGSAGRLRECLDLFYDLQKTYARLAVYAYEHESEDTGDPARQALLQKAQVIGTRLSEAASFVNPELLAIGREKLDTFFAAEPKLAIYRHPVADTLRMAPHTLDAQGEAILATFTLASGGAGSVYRVLTNAEMPWPTVKLSDGTEAKLDGSGYSLHREAADREDRRKVFDAFFGKHKEFEATLGTTLYASLKEDSVAAKVRRYPDSMTRSLDAGRIPREVYDALIRSTNANLPTLHRYFRLRGRMLGVEKMRYYDIYPPLVASTRKFPVDEGVKMMLESVKPLGEPYQAAMRKGLAERWMDVYPRPRKLSGAHMAGDAYDVHPYLLLNYTGNYESVTTLAHEWGHAMHSWFSNRRQPFATAGYATFVAEIASTLNEALLLEHALKIARDDEERLLYLGSALEGLRATFFRQAMFGEFEQKIHALVDAGEPLTGARLSEIYGEILRRYHGHEQGVLEVDPLYHLEWAYIPHFYNAFYVYQYATSIAAASLFAEAILQERPGARERYLELIASGGSDYPYELVKKAGVDLATAQPYEALARRMNGIMDEIEAILARKAEARPGKS